MNYWVLKRTPDDEDDILRAGKKSWCETRSPHLRMARGDRLFIWEMAPGSEVIGLGEVCADPDFQPRGKTTFVRLRHLTDEFAHPLAKETLLTHQELAGAIFLKKGPAGTFSALSDEHSEFLYRRVVDKNPAAASFWPDLLRGKSHSSASPHRDRATASKIQRIVAEIESRASAYAVGSLQDRRVKLKDLKHRSQRGIFSRQTMFADYAFHHGGRSELQFNVGFETVDGVETFRHGVAFSLELSQSLPSIDVFRPKIERFNEFLRCHTADLAEFHMWRYADGALIPDHPPAPIREGEIAEGTFIILGKRTSVEAVNVDEILTDFDRLLPLYEFVESGSNEVPHADSPSTHGIAFKPGCRAKKVSTSGSAGLRELDIVLRHNEIEVALHAHLVSLYGEEAVGTEVVCPHGGTIDVVVKGRGYRYFEIKTSPTARECLREAIAQLLEYSYWPTSDVATELIVVGEPELGSEARKYLDVLRSKFELPLYYARFDDATGELGPPS